jgi:Glyoxalase/Bleomycin resistance protein/Dioxygenase superfamily
MKQLLFTIALFFSITTALTQTNFKLSAQGQFFALSVKNLSESSQWYQQNLCFEKINNMIGKDSSSMTEVLKSGNIVIEIQQQKNAISKDEFKKQPDFLWHGIFKVGIYVSSIDDVIAQLKSKNVSTLIGPVTDSHNKIKFFMVRDNNRNIIQFFEAMK